MKRLIGATIWLAGLWLVASAAPAADKWVNLTSQGEAGLAGDEIQFVQAIGDDVWVGTLSGLSRHRQGTFEAVTQVQKKGKDDVVVKAQFQAWCILPNGPDSYLAGTNHGLYVVQEMRAGEQFLRGWTISPIVRLADQRLWALGKNGQERNQIFHREGDAWQPVPLLAGLRLADLVQTADRRVWVVIDGDGLAEVTDNGDSIVRHLSGMNVTTVITDSKGRVWCGFWGRGVACHDGRGWIHYLEQEKSAVIDIVEDTRGDIWVATTGGGLWHHDGEAWQRDLTDEGPINLLFASRDGRVWVSSQAAGGLRFREGGKWVESLANGLPIRCLAEPTKNALWAGGVLDGLHILKR